MNQSPERFGEVQVDSPAAQLHRVHAILEQYVGVHDAILRFSWRKLIPIPGIFRPIDYGAHFKDLTRLAIELEAAVAALGKSAGTPALVLRYTDALGDAIGLLRDMSDRLFKKSAGNPRTYPLDEYNSDLKRYHSLVAKYQALGATLDLNLRLPRTTVTRP